MKTLYLNLNMGAAGDMLCAALYQLLDEPGKAEYLRRMRALKLPEVEIVPVQTTRCGIAGTHMKVTVGGIDEGDENAHEHHHHHHEHEHHHHHHHRRHGLFRRHRHHHHHHHEDEEVYEHSHEHEHSHPHVHRSMRDIEAILANLPLTDSVRAQTLEVYRSIAEAEAAVHGTTPGEIHFHEVGTYDAIADVAGFCLLMEMLSPDEVYASPVQVGSGTVQCAHGILPVPAPATEILLRGVPIQSGDFGGKVTGELCTPTGAALLRRFVKQFGPMPDMIVEKTGYGMGSKDFPVLNAVCASLGVRAEALSRPAAAASIPVPGQEHADLPAVPAEERVIQISCNLDDMSPEDIGFARLILTDAGALDVWTESIGMKKSRPGVMLSILCPVDQADRFADLMLKHTTTLGVRMVECRRKTLDRTFEQIDTPYGKLTVKRATGQGVNRVKPEFDELSAMAKAAGLSLSELRAKLKRM